jgi:catechol 2,3-dioxygenase-like lactoylglutathione lyase family enzyme
MPEARANEYRQSSPRAPLGVRHYLGGEPDCQPPQRPRTAGVGGAAHGCWTPGSTRAVMAPMAAALGLDHLVLVVADVDRALDWYGRHAGLRGERVDAWRRGEVPFPSLRVDDTTLIDVIPGLADPDQRGHLDHICFVVGRADLDALAQDAALELVDRGRRFGARGEAESIYVRDPDGLLVEFRTYDE